MTDKSKHLNDSWLGRYAAAIRERDELRAEVERLRDENTRLDALIDRGLFAEIDRLRAEIVRALDEPTQNEHDLYTENKRQRDALVQIENWVGKLPSNMGEAALVFEYIRQACSVLDQN